MMRRGKRWTLLNQQEEAAPSEGSSVADNHQSLRTPPRSPSPQDDGNERERRGRQSLLRHSAAGLDYRIGQEIDIRGGGSPPYDPDGSEDNNALPTNLLGNKVSGLILRARRAISSSRASTSPHQNHNKSNERPDEGETMTEFLDEELKVSGNPIPGSLIATPTPTRSSLKKSTPTFLEPAQQSLQPLKGSSGGIAQFSLTPSCDGSALQSRHETRLSEDSSASDNGGACCVDVPAAGTTGSSSLSIVKQVRFEGRERGAEFRSGETPPNHGVHQLGTSRSGVGHARQLSSSSLDDSVITSENTTPGSTWGSESGLDSSSSNIGCGGGARSGRRKMHLHSCSISFDGVRVNRQARWCPTLSLASINSKRGGCDEDAETLSSTIHEASGIFDTGALHAIVSPFDKVSTTMAQTLAGIIPSSSGVIMLNQYPVRSAPYQLAVSYVNFGSGPLTIKDDTVTANLNFAVKMRMDTSYSRSRIKAALRQLGLEPFADEPVQSIPNLQQRLVQVAMELVADPCVLILDCPSEGLSLDEFSAFTRWMQKLAQQGNRAIVLAMKTLPWTLFECVESLLLLSRDGRTIFSGHTARCVRFLRSSLGCSIAQVSSGESIIDLVTEWDDCSSGKTRRAVNTFRNSAYGTDLQKSLKTLQDLVMSSGFRKLPYTPPPPPQCLLRFFTLAYDTLRRTMIRNDFFMVWIALFVSFFLCAALSQRQQSDQNGMQNKRGIIFFLLSCVVHSNGIFIESELLDFTTFVRLRQRRYFSTMSYILVTVTRLAAPRVLFALGAAAFSHFVFRAASVPLAVLLGLTSFTHSILLLIAVAVFKTRELVMGAHLAYYAYSVIFSGFLLANPTVPWVLPKLSLLEPGYSAAVHEELKGQPYSCDADELLYLPDGKVLKVFNETEARAIPGADIVRSYCYSGDQYLELQGFIGDTFGANAVQLTVWSLVLLAVLFLTVYFRK